MSAKSTVISDLPMRTDKPTGRNAAAGGVGR
jgi:hypothetical protein